MIAHDPQTSGGLLLAMEAAAGATLCERLRGCEGEPACALIGTVRAGDPGRVHGHRLNPAAVQADRTGQGRARGRVSRKAW